MNENVSLSNKKDNLIEDSVNKSSSIKSEIKKIYNFSHASTFLLIVEIFVLAFLLIYIITAKINNLTTNYEKTIKIVLQIIAGIESVRILFLIILLILIFICKNKSIKNNLIVLAILSLIPAISFITFIILKIRIKKMYLKSLDL